MEPQGCLCLVRLSNKNLTSDKYFFPGSSYAFSLGGKFCSLQQQMLRFSERIWQNSFFFTVSSFDTSGFVHKVCSIFFLDFMVGAVLHFWTVEELVPLTSRRSASSLCYLCDICLKLKKLRNCLHTTGHILSLKTLNVENKEKVRLCRFLLCLCTSCL